MKLLLSKEREIFKNRWVLYGGLKFIVNSTDQEISFSELKHPVAFLDSIKKRQILTKQARNKQK